MKATGTWPDCLSLANFNNSSYGSSHPKIHQMIHKLKHSLTCSGFWWPASTTGLRLHAPKEGKCCDILWHYVVLWFCGLLSVVVKIHMYMFERIQTEMFENITVLWFTSDKNMLFLSHVTTFFGLKTKQYIILHHIVMLYYWIMLHFVVYCLFMICHIMLHYHLSFCGILYCGALC